jgi:hypothetical protein
MTDYLASSQSKNVIMIYKTFFGTYIDLDKLVSVGKAEFIDRIGCGGWFVGFEMHFQLMDKPIYFERILHEPEEYSYNPNEIRKFQIVRSADDKLKCVENLQKQIDELVSDWKSFKDYKNNES